MPYHPVTMERRTTTTHIVVHGAFTPPDMDVGIDTVREWHVSAPNNYDDVGYQIFIRRSGAFEFGRPLDVEGAHAPPVNDRSIGICLAGGRHPTKKVWQSNYTYPQLARLGFLIDAVKMLYPKTVVMGHRDVQGNRECPGFDVAAWWAARSID